MFSTTKEMEVLILTPTEYERKIALLERTVSKFKEKSKKASAALISAKKKNQELEKSRDSWKAKSRVKSLTIKSLKKQVCRLDKPARHHFSLDLIQLSFLFRQKGKCSYTSISRLLAILGTSGVLNLPRVPCANTVQNWVSKMGLNTLDIGSSSLDVPRVSLMVDESIKIGEEKLLVVLCCNSDKSELGALNADTPRLEQLSGTNLGIGRPHCLAIAAQSGLSLSDMRICHIESRKAWTGKEISYVLTHVIDKLAVCGQTVDYIQTDGESKLKNAVDLIVLPQVLDISHSIGNCLKKTFEKEDAFVNFTTLLGSYQSKGVNQALTYLIPPKQRSKVRFMNLKPVVVWATKMLARMDKLNEKERTFFKELPQHTPFIKGLTEVMYFEEKVTKALKTNGLTQQLLFKIIQELTLFKALDFGLYNNLKDKFAVCFEGFLAKYQTVLDQTKVHNLVSLNVSTDIIESLFAKYKAIMPSNKYHSMASTAIELPIYCTDDNNIDQQQIKQAVEKYFTANLIEWKASYSVGSQAIKRRKFFKN
jgi:hypothetical protein